MYYLWSKSLLFVTPCLFLSGMSAKRAHFPQASHCWAAWGYGHSLTLGFATTGTFSGCSFFDAAGTEPISEKKHVVTGAFLERHCWNLCAPVLMKQQCPDPRHFPTLTAPAQALWAKGSFKHRCLCDGWVVTTKMPEFCDSMESCSSRSLKGRCKNPARQSMKSFPEFWKQQHCTLQALASKRIAQVQKSSKDIVKGRNTKGVSQVPWPRLSSSFVLRVVITTDCNFFQLSVFLKWLLKKYKQQQDSQSCCNKLGAQLSLVETTLASAICSL